MNTPGRPWPPPESRPGDPLVEWPQASRSALLTVAVQQAYRLLVRLAGAGPAQLAGLAGTPVPQAAAVLESLRGKGLVTPGPTFHPLPRATPVLAAAPGADLPPAEVLLLSLFVSGMPDKSIATHLGTVQRRLDRLMAVQAARRGRLAAPTSPARVDAMPAGAAGRTTGAARLSRSRPAR